MIVDLRWIGPPRGLFYRLLRPEQERGDTDAGTVDRGAASTIGEDPGSHGYAGVVGGDCAQGWRGMG